MYASFVETLNMKYLDQINLFNDLTEIADLSTTAQLLWFKLMHINNRSYWAPAMNINNQTLMGYLKISSPQALIKAREELVNNGLIDYVDGKYKMRPLVRDEAGIHGVDSGEVRLEPEPEEQVEIEPEPKKEPKTKSKPKKPKADPIPYKEIYEFWNANHGGMPSMQNFTDKRKRQVRKLVNEGYSLDELKKGILKAAESDFLSGRVKKWRADFDWITKSSNLIKVLEGNYDNRPTPVSEMTADEYLTAGGAGLIDITGQPIPQNDNLEGFQDYEISDDEVFSMDDPEIIAWVNSGEEE